MDQVQDSSCMEGDYLHPFGGQVLYDPQTTTAGFSLHFLIRKQLWFGALALSRSWCQKLVGRVLTWMSSDWYPPFLLFSQRFSTGGLSLVVNRKKTLRWGFWGLEKQVGISWVVGPFLFFIFLHFSLLCILELSNKCISGLQRSKPSYFGFFNVCYFHEKWPYTTGGKSCWGCMVLKNTWTNV